MSPIFHALFSIYSVFTKVRYVKLRLKTRYRSDIERYKKYGHVDVVNNMHSSYKKRKVSFNKSLLCHLISGDTYLVEKLG
jgi:hypothetical protein